ncbi:MAG: hypothetical protein COW62_04205 [Zetaproteobacteria bacterium CG17_big_fil_post_rev_8_21_14_2_50_50_13]|nr:MAG: hypothetical protein COW62_04205 [Zetaproteobacteria bacterium CG17_big_fil_post_rev_8_21_14_2_50_50_13]
MNCQCLIHNRLTLQSNQKNELLTKVNVSFSMHAMIVTCPTCAARYRFSAVIRNAVLVCHHCGTEFDLSDQDSSAKKNDAPQRPHANQSLPFDRKPEQVDATVSPPKKVITPKKNATLPTPKEKVEAKAKTSPPPPIIPATSVEPELPEILPLRKKARIWPWAIFVLLLIGAVGIWNNQSLWRQHAWVRAAEIEAQQLWHQWTGSTMRDVQTDGLWEIKHASMHIEWIERLDGSKVLVISGTLKNMLPIRMPPPTLRVGYTDESGANPLPVDLTLAMTEPPAMLTIQRTPFISPPVDTTPIRAQGQRDFLLVLEAVPEHAAHLVVTTQKKSQP